MKIKVGEEEIDLEGKYLEVDEISMNDFLKNFASVYNHYNSQWAKAQYLHSCSEDDYDVAYSSKFQFYKEGNGGSDKLVEAKTLSHPEVVEAKKATRDAKYTMQLLFTYLRALDKAHESALNLGYNLRKELDKIFPQQIKTSSGFDKNVDDEVAKMFEA